MRTILYLFSAFTAITLAYREMAYPKPADTFYLKTKTVGSLSNVGTSKDSLYVTSFPVSLGGSAQDVTLSKDKSTAIKLYLDDTHLMVDMGNPSPWAISSTHSLKGSSSYVAWAGLKIDNGYGSDNFYYLNDTTGLEWTYNSAYDDIRTPDPFLSWLACDWSHGIPQLFWRVDSPFWKGQNKITETCTEVKLIKVPVQG